MVPHSTMAIAMAIIIHWAGCSWGERVLGRLVQHAEGATDDGVSAVDDFLAGELSALRIRRGDVTASLSDLWQHHIGHPALENLGLWKFGRENESVEAALVDEDYASELT